MGIINPSQFNILFVKFKQDSLFWLFFTEYFLDLFDFFLMMGSTLTMVFMIIQKLRHFSIETGLFLVGREQILMQDQKVVVE